MHFTAGSSAADLQLYVATRASTADTWANTVLAPYSSAGASQQTLTADQLVVLWSAKNATTSDFDLYFAVRASTADAFGPTKRLSVSTSDNDFEPYIREDGCELHWTHGPGGAGTGNIYEVMYKP